MARYKSIGEYRRKKRLGRLLKKVILVLLVAGVMILLINILDIFQGTGLKSFFGGESGDQVFPLTIKNEQMVGITPFYNHISVLTKTNVLIYGLNGERTNSIIHGYTNPVLKVNGKRALTYDRGGYKLRVDTPDKNIGEVELKNVILCAQISASGQVAVVTNHDRYACEVLVYDSNLQEPRYRYYATEGLTSIEFSEGDQVLTGSAVVSSGGILSAQVYRLNTAEEEDVLIKLMKDVVPLSVTTHGDVVWIIGKNETVFYDLKSGSESRYTYPGALQCFSVSEKTAVLVNQDLKSNHSVLTLLLEDGSGQKTYAMNDDVLDIYHNDSRIAVLCKSAAYNFDMSLGLLNTIELTKSMNKLTYDAENLYILGMDSLEKHPAA